MFGRGKRPEKELPTATLDWHEIRKFSAAIFRATGAFTPQMQRRCEGRTPVWATAAERPVRQWELAAYADQPVEGGELTGGFGLFADPYLLRPICRLLDPEAADAGRLVYTATDDQGNTIGSLTKVPPTRRPFKHTWRLHTPDGATLHGRNAWTTKQQFTGTLRSLIGSGKGFPLAETPEWETARGRHLSWGDPTGDGARTDRTHLMESAGCDFAHLTDTGMRVLDQRLALLAVLAEARSLHLPDRY